MLFFFPFPFFYSSPISYITPTTTNNPQTTLLMGWHPPRDAGLCGRVVVHSGHSRSPLYYVRWNTGLRRKAICGQRVNRKL